MASNLLIKLPIDLVEEISAYLSLKELASIVKTSDTTNRLFHQSLSVRKARSLLQYVIEANYVKVAQIVSADSMLMFEKVEWMLNGKYALMNPVQYAFYVNDTYMWRIFLSKITRDSKQLDSFLQIAKEQTHHLDLSELYSSYDTFSANYNVYWDAIEPYYRKSPSMYLEPFDEEWTPKINESLLHIGVKQRECLPAHLLKEFCRTGNAPSREAALEPFNCRDGNRASIFDTPNLSYPEECRISIYLEPFTLLDTHDLGSKFTLIRGHYNHVSAIDRVDYCRWGNCDVFWIQYIQHDCSTLQNLYTRKCKQFKELQLDPEKEINRLQKNTSGWCLIL